MIVQEASLSKYSTCFCGDVPIPLSAVLTCARWVRHKFIHLPFQLRTYQGLLNAATIWSWANYNDGRRESDLLTRAYMIDLIVGFGDFECYDKRDTVFAILGLYLAYSGLEQLPPALLPDYTKSLTQIMRDTTRFAIAERQDLAIFQSLYHEPPNHPRQVENPGDWPSWVPRWHQARSTDHYLIDLRFIFNARGKRLEVEFASSLLDEPTILAVKGITVDSVVRSSEPMTNADFSTTDIALGTVERLRCMLADLQLIPANQELDAILALALTAGTSSRCTRLEKIDAERQFNAYVGYLRRNERPPYIHELDSSEDPLEPSEGKLAADFALAEINACKCRRFFITGTGLPGVGPWTMAPSDVVAVLFGCAWPVVLRARVEDGHYEVRGIAYVYGIMDGEAVQAHEANGGVDHVFSLH
ncbi:hypothetical protein LTR81_022527 [Elasticomyces elasticus]